MKPKKHLEFLASTAFGLMCVLVQLHVPWMGKKLKIRAKKNDWKESKQEKKKSASIFAYKK